MPARHDADGHELLAVKHELLVRYLDAWVAATLHRGGRATFVCETASPVLVSAALGVFAEFSDLLARHPLDIVLAPRTPVPAVALPVGLGMSVDAAPSLPGPVLGFFDGPRSGDAGLLAEVARVAGGEVLALLAEPLDPGTSRQCQVGLVAADGSSECLVFGAPTDKALQQFKDELWALDEYAGVRLRDPGDDTLLDISVRPNIGPLRRLLHARLHTVGPQSVADLRSWTLHHTVYRAGDATPALQAMLAAGEATREPSTGRLTSATLILPPVPHLSPPPASIMSLGDMIDAKIRPQHLDQRE